MWRGSTTNVSRPWHAASRLQTNNAPGGTTGSIAGHIPTDLVVAQKASDVESSSRLDFLLLHNLRRRFVA
jgi:hypothetical protein